MAEKNVLNFQPAKTKRASEVVYDQIYEKIVSGELEAGTRLPSERVLSEQFGRSRHIIREALRMLQQDGLVKIEVGSAGGTIVQGVSRKTVEEPLMKFLGCGAVDLEDLIEYRYISDHGCVRLAASHHTAEDKAALQSIMEEMNGHFSNREEFFAMDIAFHKALGKATHNELAIMINEVLLKLSIDMIHDATASYDDSEIQEYFDRVCENHTIILEGILSGDPNAADKAIDDTVELFHEPFHE